MSSTHPRDPATFDVDTDPATLPDPTWRDWIDAIIVALVFAGVLFLAQFLDVA